MRNSTLLFLIKRDSSTKAITDICLAMKKRGFGVGRYNGVGGKVNEKEGETIPAAAIREAEEEIGVKIGGASGSSGGEGALQKIAEHTFTFPHNEAWNQVVHTYFCEEWQGDPVESEEMKPQWFAVGDIPYATMWPDDKFWLPRALAGEKLHCAFTFGEGDIILEQKIEKAKDL